MMDMNTQTTQIIDALGGTVATAKLCNVTPHAVSQWRTRGFPKARIMFLRAVRPDLFPKEMQIKPIRTKKAKNEI